MVDSFDWQNVSAPTGPSSVAKRYKTDHDLFCIIWQHFDVARLNTRVFHGNFSVHNVLGASFPF